MSMEKVQQALLQRFLTDYGLAWVNRIAYENLVFSPPKAQPWLSVHFIPADERIATLGVNGRDVADGIFQVTIHIPVGAGETTIRQTVNQLRLSFKPQVLGYGGQPVTILSRSRSNGGPRDGFYVIPFSVRWRAQLNRSS